MHLVSSWKCRRSRCGCWWHSTWITSRLIFHLMFEHVIAESLLVTELLIAILAGEWLLSGVCPQVTFDGVRMSEFFITILARIGFFAAVQSHVASITLRIGKSSAAFLTVKGIHILVIRTISLSTEIDTHHLYGCSPVCILICSRRLCGWANFFGQTVHGYRSSPVCVRMCTKWVAIWANDFPQTTHWYGRSPVWVLQEINLVTDNWTNLSSRWIKPEPDVCGVGAFVNEFVFAIFTLEWVVPGVFSRVIIVRLRIDEGCITVIALVRPFARMLPAGDDRELRDNARCEERLWSHLPKVRFVWLQLEESLATFITMIRLLPGVGSEVFDE